MASAPEQNTEQFIKKIVRACRLFTVRELTCLLDKPTGECFPPDVKSADVCKVIMRNRLTPEKINYINVIEDILTKCKLTQDACIKHLQNLSFQDVMLHDKRTWQIIELLDPLDPNKVYLSPAQLKTKILRKLSTRQQQALIQIQCVDHINWCMIIEMKVNKKGVPRYGHTTYFSYTNDQNSICVCTNKTGHILDVLVECFGYSNYKTLDLKGKDVRTLHRSVPKTLNDSDRNARRSKRLSSGSNRNTVLQEVEIKAVTEWKGAKVRKRKKLETVTSICKIQGPNVGAFIQTLIKDGIIKDPNAPWLAQLKHTKSNTVMLEE